MKKLARLVGWIMLSLVEAITGCTANVRYHDPGRDLQLEVKPADRAADLIE